MSRVKSQLIAKASENLDKSVKADLVLEDLDLKEIINENTKGDDSGRSGRANPENSEETR